MAPAAKAAVSRRAPQATALTQILAPALESGFGVRHGVLGVSGAGKTWWMERFTAHGLDLGAYRWAFVHDIKDGTTQYNRQGTRITVRADVADLKARPLEPGDSRVIVFCSDDVHPNEVAQLGIDFGAGGQPALVLVDELYDALKGERAFEGGIDSPVDEILRKGRSKGVSLCWTTQIPQSLPTSAFVLSDTFALFRMESRALEYLDKQLWFPAQVFDLVPKLQNGEFLLYHKGQPWDGVIYGPA